MLGMRYLKILFTIFEESLGMMPKPEIYREFISGGAPDAAKLKEELEALIARENMSEEQAVDLLVEKGTTVFPRDDDGTPLWWDYQMKGFCKDAAGMLNRAQGSLSSQLVAYKKIIDGLVFPDPRKIRIILPEGGQMGQCGRPMRAMTKNGEITALVNSETVPAGSKFEVTFKYFDLRAKKGKVEVDADAVAPEVEVDAAEADEAKIKLATKVSKKGLLHDCIVEWCEYTALRGFGAWRNSGKGRATYEILSDI